MDPSRWQRIESMLDVAFDLPESEQRKFVDAQCGDDNALRADLEALLQGDRKAGAILDEGVSHGLLSAIVVEHDVETMLAPGTRIGAYRVLRLIGRGGMGEVYLGERADGAFEQRAALKLIKRGMDTTHVLRRFYAERRILARLVHPNIAHLLDGGIGPDGRPYFAMEYIEGEPLAAYVASNAPDVHARLRLFLEVAAAVDYAHRQLVVHRDLKPSNILVRSNGRIALLDFGVAKLLESADTEDSAQTEFGARALTPAYAAPEQLRGDPVSTATDVYGLGAVLYYLLTGAPPLRLPSQSLADLELSVRDLEPIPPSVRLRAMPRDADTRAYEVLGGVGAGWIADLDTIVLKALCQSPHERYASAAAMAGDVGRLLDGHPILARAHGVGYRVRKFVGRNRRLVALGAMLAFAIVAGVAATFWQTRAALHEAERTARIKDFVLGLFDATDPEGAAGRSRTVRELLDRGSARALTELESQPDIQADVLFTVGRLYEQHGWFEPAAELSARSLALRRTVASPPAIAEALHEVGVVAHWRMRYDDAEHAYREALAMRQQSLGRDHALTAQTESLLGRLEFERNRNAEAEPHLRHALAVLQASGGGHAADVASVLNTLGRLEQARQDLDVAETDYRESLAVRERLFGPNHPAVSESLTNLGTLAEMRGRFDEAASLYERALKIRIASRGADHASVGVVETNLGILQMTLAHYDTAAQHLQRALDIKRASYGEDAPQLAVAWHNLARLALVRGDTVAAESMSRRALDAATSMFGREHPNVAAVLQMRAELALAKADPETADALAREALANLGHAMAADHPRIVDIRLLLARIAFARGDISAAEPLARDVLAARRVRFGDSDWRTAEAQLWVAECARRADRANEAVALSAKAHAALVAALGDAHPLARQAASFGSTTDTVH